MVSPRLDSWTVGDNAIGLPTTAVVNNTSAKDGICRLIASFHQIQELSGRQKRGFDESHVAKKHHQ